MKPLTAFFKGSSQKKEVTQKRTPIEYTEPITTHKKEKKEFLVLQKTEEIKLDEKLELSHPVFASFEAFAAELGDW